MAHRKRQHRHASTLTIIATMHNIASTSHSIRTRVSHMFVAVLCALLLLPAAASARQTPHTGTLIIAHGGGPEWNAQVEAVAALVNTGGPVAVSYLMGPGASANPFQQVARRLVDQGAREIVVVPLLVSSHSGHYEQIRYIVGETDELDEVMHHHLHMAGIERADVPVPVRLARALDDAPEVATVLAERALALAENPATQALFLMAHGPNSAEDNAAWMKNLRPLAEHVAATTSFRNVMIGTVRDDAPAEVRAEAVRSIREIIELQHLATGQSVVVVPVLISTGQVSREKFPRDLAGLPVSYSGDALLPHAGLARWIESRVREPGRPAPAKAGASRPSHPGHGGH